MNISEDSLTPKFVGSAEMAHQRPSPIVDAAVFGAALLGHLTAFGARWNQDDWELLGRAAGLVETGGGFPARFVSRQLYWDLTWPLFGTSPAPHTIVRLLVFALCAVLVTRIAARAGLTTLPRLVAGLMVAASPLAFTPMYWAAGIQELLGAVFALAAIERWLAGSRRDLLLASALALLSMFSKESGLGLGLLFLVMLFVGVGPAITDRVFGWGMCLLLLLFAIVEGVLVVQHFPTGAGELFAMGSPAQIAVNLGTMGWWMLSPGPFLAGDLLWPQMAAGTMLFVLWGVWSITQFRQNNRLPLLTLVAALMSIAAALPLETQLSPYLGFLGVCAGALAVASLVPSHWNSSPVLLVGLSLLAAAWGFFGMETRSNQRNESQLPADPLVRANSLSWQISRMLPQLPLQRIDGQRQAVTILQVPKSSQQMEMADRLGEQWVTRSQLHSVIGGSVGPRLVLGEEARVDWVNALFNNPREAIVLCEAGTDFKHWGTTGNAALYAALTDIGMRRFERARKHLMRAAGLSDDTLAFAYDSSQMIISSDLVLAQKEDFIDWTVGLLGPEHSPQEVGGLQDLFLNILSSCTNLSVEELSQGSTLIIKEKPVRAKKVENPKGNQGE